MSITVQHVTKRASGEIEVGFALEWVALRDGESRTIFNHPSVHAKTLYWDEKSDCVPERMSVWFMVGSGFRSGESYLFKDVLVFTPPPCAKFMSLEVGGVVTKPVLLP